MNILDQIGFEQHKEVYSIIGVIIGILILSTVIFYILGRLFSTFFLLMDNDIKKIKNQLNINYQIKSTNSKVIFSLYNMMGALINTIKEENVSVGDQSLSLDFSSYDNMSDGIYFISLNINGKVQTKHFILNR